MLPRKRKTFSHVASLVEYLKYSVHLCPRYTKHMPDKHEDCPTILSRINYRIQVSEPDEEPHCIVVLNEIKQYLDICLRHDL